MTITSLYEYLNIKKKLKGDTILNSTILTIFESIMIVTALSMDAFVASFAYGTNKIKIPFSSVTVINVVCSSILAISLFLGSIISGFIPENITHIICFFILFLLGVTKLGESIVSWIANKGKNIKYNMKFGFMGLNFTVNINSDTADENIIHKKVLKPGEAASLSIALSLDGLAVGFGAALANADSVQIVLFSLISDMVAVMLGCFLGNRVAEKVSFNLSWLSGLMLMVLAFLKLS